MRRSRCALIAILLALPPAHAESSSASDASDPLSVGPLRVRDQFILSLGFLAFDPASAEVVAPQQWQLDVIFTTANSWAVSAPLEIELDARDRREPITLDQLNRLTGESLDGSLIFANGEVSRTVVAIRRGFRGGFQIELQVPFLRYSGGGFDGFIESFHDTLGLEQAGRLGAPKDDLLIFLDTRQGEFRLEESSGPELGDLVLGTKVRLRGETGAPLQVSVEALVKLPTAQREPLGTSGEIDVGAQLLAGHTFDKWGMHGSLGVLQLGSSERLGLSSQTLVSGMLSAERRLGEKTSFVLQGMVSQSPFGELEVSRIGKNSFQVTGGFKRALGRRNMLFVGFTENLENFNNSADVGLHVGISRTLN